jgi:hypothetical protein
LVSPLVVYLLRATFGREDLCPVKLCWSARNERMQGRKDKTMKYIVLVAVMFVLVFGAFAAQKDTPTAGVSVVSANAVVIEGVEFDGQKAWLKVGYQFQIESSSSLAVLKTSNEARIQTGTLTCTRHGRGACTVRFDRSFAACSQSCVFVGYRGGTRTQRSAN